MKYLCATFLSCMLLGLAGAGAHAADYPEKSIRTVVPYAPGGASDVVARVVGQGMEQSLGQVLVVDNRPGGGAIIGTGMVANAEPDGYTIGVVDSAFVINPALVADRIPYDARRDFEPVALLARMPFLLLVNAAVPAQTVAELVALAKAQPGMLNYGSAGNGSPLHLAAEQFKHAAGIDIVHVPYKGGAPSIAAIVAGETQVTMSVLSTSLSYIQSGRLRALAVTGDSRLPELPDVPTFAELGMPQVDSFVSFGVVAPRGTPAHALQRLNAAFNERLQDRQVGSKLADLGFQPIGGDPQAYRRFIDGEIAKWIQFTSATGIKADF